MAVKKGERLPKEVTMAAGTVGMRLTDIADYRVGDEFVSIINHRGQKYTFELVKLNPSAAVTPPQSPPRRGGGKAKPRKRAQQELKGVL